MNLKHDLKINFDYSYNNKKLGNIKIVENSFPCFTTKSYLKINDEIAGYSNWMFNEDIHNFLNTVQKDLISINISELADDIIQEIGLNKVKTLQEVKDNRDFLINGIQYLIDANNIKTLAELKEYIKKSYSDYLLLSSWDKEGNRFNIRYIKFLIYYYNDYDEFYKFLLNPNEYIA